MSLRTHAFHAAPTALAAAAAPAQAWLWWTILSPVAARDRW